MEPQELIDWLEEIGEIHRLRKEASED